MRGSPLIRTFVLTSLTLFSVSDRASSQNATTTTTTTTTATLTTTTLTTSTTTTTTTATLTTSSCFRNASRCVELPGGETLNCFGTTLPHKAASFAFTGLNSYWDVQDRLSAWSALRFVPKCWSVIQPLLCSVYLPPCDPRTNRVRAIPASLCRMVQGPCRIVSSSGTSRNEWPDFLNCDNRSVFYQDGSFESAAGSFVSHKDDDDDECRDGQDVVVVSSVSPDAPKQEGPSGSTASSSSPGALGSSPVGSGPLRRTVLRFNTSGSCMAPYMVEADQPVSFYEQVDECGLSCSVSPFHSKEEKRSMSNFVFVGTVLCILASAFSAASYLVAKTMAASAANRNAKGATKAGGANAANPNAGIEGTTSSKVPRGAQGSGGVSDRIVFIMNCCFLLVMIGMASQFFASVQQRPRDQGSTSNSWWHDNPIVCRSDGTRRVAEPGAGEDLACTVVFILVYYFSMAILVWVVVLCYCWSLTFSGLGKARTGGPGSVRTSCWGGGGARPGDSNSRTGVQGFLEKQMVYFHVLSWSLPLVLTIAIIFMNAVEGDELVGICFVTSGPGGQQQPPINSAWFLVAPVVSSALVMSGLTLRICLVLHRLSRSAGQVISEEAGGRVKAALFRIIALFVAPAILLMVSTVVHQTYMMQGYGSWKSALRQFLVCQARNGGGSGGGPSTFPEGPPENLALSSATSIGIGCELKDRPSFLRVQMQVLCLFSACILVSSLTWTRSTLRNWRDFLVLIAGKFVLSVAAAVSAQFGDQVAAAAAAAAAAAGDDPGGRSGQGQRAMMMVRKHKLISQAYAKRGEFQKTGRLSLTFDDDTAVGPGVPAADRGDVRKSHQAEDEGPEELSSTWAAALPRLVQRRGALVGAIGLGLKRSNSVDSDLNLSVTIRSRAGGLSLDSRRHSIGSQFSLQQSELDYLQNLYARAASSTSMNAGLKRSHKKPPFGRRKLFPSRTTSAKSKRAGQQPYAASSYMSSRMSSCASRADDECFENDDAVSQVLPAITLNLGAAEEADVAKFKPEGFDQMKSRLEDGVFQVPLPGRSVALGRGAFGQPDGDGGFEFIELQERLKTVNSSSPAAAVGPSLDSNSTPLGTRDLVRPVLEVGIEIGEGNVKETKTANGVEASVQTDLPLDSRTALKDASIQVGHPMLLADHPKAAVRDQTGSSSPIFMGASTSSSSQAAESSRLLTSLPIKRAPGESANLVTKIHIPSSEDSSSIPSSYEKDYAGKGASSISKIDLHHHHQQRRGDHDDPVKTLSIIMPGLVVQDGNSPMNHGGLGDMGAMPRPSLVPQHNRGRRGGIANLNKNGGDGPILLLDDVLIGNDEAKRATSGLVSNMSTGHTLGEVELRSQQQKASSASRQRRRLSERLQEMPDAILAVSSPSS